MKPPIVALYLLRIFIFSAGAVVTPESPRQGAALLKTDLMGIFAHPDDETGMAGTLAYYALAKGAVIANVYCTRGEGGGNMVGTQSGLALGVLREAEVRDCLQMLGVRHCYFLDRLDWAYTESATATLQKWGHEETLENLVRMIRALRPEVILTMNPAPAPGQHGHHQAAGILAIEAFDAAADPGRFPEHLKKEGLAPWQPRKIFYGGSEGPANTTIGLKDPLPGGKLAGEVAAAALSNHRSQGFGNFRRSPWPPRPQSFITVKSVVPFTTAEVDLFAGLPVAKATPMRIQSGPPDSSDSKPVTMEFVPRPAIGNYLRWMKAQGIQHLGSRFKADVPLVAGEAGEVKLEFHNRAGEAISGGLQLMAPDDWLVDAPKRRLSLAAGSVLTTTVRLTPPAGRIGDGILKVQFTGVGGGTMEADAVGHVVPLARVQRTSHPPAFDGSNEGWGTAASLVIAASDLVQGTVAGEPDSSARCRLMHDGTTLFVDIEVKDDVVVSNIEPDDIKGHWRSDALEICLDPLGGAEDTMGCFKLGIIPFDTTGKVRASRDADANQGPVEETAPGTRMASQRTANGYRVEVAIPWREIGLVPTQGKRMGFNLIIYDGDDNKAAPGANINKSRIAWSPRSGVQGRPEDWGRIDLD